MTFVQKTLIDDTSWEPLTGGVQNSTFLPAHLEVAATRFENLEVELDPHSRIYWAFMKPQAQPSFTLGLLDDMREMQERIRHMFAERAAEPTQPFDYLVFASRMPGIYNLGGDLRHFAERIRARDRASMRSYAHLCIETIWRNAHAFHVPVITMALVQGDALGGGFECALSYDLLVAERSAKLGLPEILFNLFPGMGAYSFLSRRMDAVRTERMIMSGRLYTAEELYDMGVVDVLAEDGQGEAAVLEYVERHARKHNAHRAIYQARRRVNPVTREELFDVVDIWVDAALNLGEADLRKMLRLAAAQDRRLAGSTPIIRSTQVPAMAAE